MYNYVISITIIIFHKQYINVIVMVLFMKSVVTLSTFNGNISHSRRKKIKVEVNIQYM